LVTNNININSNILELGCGTGKHAQILSEFGYNITGIDISSQMIENAVKNTPTNLNSRLEYFVGNVQNFRIEKKFDVIISLFHVVSYQSSNEDLLSMFKTASVHLKKGGIFIFDCWYGPGVLFDPPTVRVKRIEKNSIKIIRIAEPIFHPNENIVDVNYTIQVDNGKGLIESILEKHRMRYLFNPEIIQYAKENSMNVIDKMGWLTKNNVGFDTWTATFILEKIGDNDQA
jgi:SAM-dependent methyltransferase